MKYIHTFLVFLLFFMSAVGQKVREEDLRFANNIVEVFDENEVVLRAYKSMYEFVYNEEKSKLEVNTQEQKEFISLQYNSSFTERNYFNQNLKINSYSLKDARGRDVSHDKFCGHYSSDGIFHSDAEVCAYHLSFPSKGDYRLFETSKTYSDPKYLTSVYFNAVLPSVRRKITFKIPSWVDVELLEMNFEGYDIAKHTIEVNGTSVITYEIKNIGSYPDEENLPGISHYLPHLLILTKGYTKNEIKHDVLSSTNSLFNWYKSLIDLNTTDLNILEPAVQEIIRGCDSDEEKVRAIYYWVQENIKYIAFEEGLAAFKPEESHHVYRNKYGDCKGMTNLMKDMLLIAGLDARLSWIGTDKIAYTYEVPSLAVDNHMICTVNLDGSFHFLDATEKNHPFESYAERLQGKQILIEDGSSYIIDQIPLEPIEKYLKMTEAVFSITDGGLKAEITESIQGEYKKGLIHIYESLSPDRKEIFFKSLASGDFETSDVSIKNQPTLEKEAPLLMEYDLKMDKYLNTFGDETYLTLDHKKPLIDYKVEKDRKAPVKFSRKINNQFRGSLAIPDTWEVSHLPSELSLSSDYFEFNLRYELAGNSINYFSNLKVLNTYLPKEEFSNWNNAIEQLNSFYNDQIILTVK